MTPTILLTLWAALAAAPAAVAQGPEDPRQEVKRLFEQVSKDLDEIDKLLLQAASDRRSKAGAGEAATEKDAAKEAHGKQREVVDAIQKILELVPRTGSSQSSGSGGQPSSKSDGNLPDDPGQQREDSGAPRGENQAPKDPSGGKPDDPRESKEKPKNGVKPPRDYATERRERGDLTVDRWGELPEQVREAFTNESTQDVPIRYRKWIQDFYKRVQRGSTPGGRR